MRPSAQAIVADLATLSSRELTAHADELESRRDELQALAGELDKRLAGALFAGESGDDLKRELAATQEALADVERALKGSATAIASARKTEAAERRCEDVREYNAAIRRARKNLKRLLTAIDVIPHAAQAAMGDVDEARELYSLLFAADPQSAPVRCPAEPGRYLKDALNNISSAAYGHTGGAGIAAKARERLAHLVDGLELPED